MTPIDDVPKNQPSFSRHEFKQLSANAHHAYACATSLAIAMGFESACDPGTRTLGKDKRDWIKMMINSLQIVDPADGIPKPSSDRARNRSIETAMYFGRKPNGPNSTSVTDYWLLFPHLMQRIQDDPRIMAMWQNKVVEPAWTRAWSDMERHDYVPRQYLKYNFQGNKEEISRLRKELNSYDYYNMWPASPSPAADEDENSRHKILAEAWNMMRRTVANANGDASIRPLYNLRDMILISISRVDQSLNEPSDLGGSFKKHDFGNTWDARYAAGIPFIVSQNVYGLQGRVEVAIAKEPSKRRGVSNISEEEEEISNDSEEDGEINDIPQEHGLMHNFTVTEDVLMGTSAMPEAEEESRNDERVVGENEGDPREAGNVHEDEAPVHIKLEPQDEWSNGEGSSGNSPSPKRRRVLQPRGIAWNGSVNPEVQR